MITVVPATIAHARSIRLRPGDALEVAAYGIGAEQAIAQSMARSLWAETYLIDGEVAAIVGLGLSTFVGGHGVPWLLTGPACERHKRRFMNESRRQVARMLETVSPLVNYVHADYARAIRWLAWLGFVIDPPQRGFCRFYMEA
ncbi:MAG TPA: hypothetical protein VFB13_01985 [Reyranella sp.]|jgi:hypothetical protein|nr:hypothetical protein [Reyranella sp.]